MRDYLQSPVGIPKIRFPRRNAVYRELLGWLASTGSFDAIKSTVFADEPKIHPSTGIDGRGKTDGGKTKAR
jgi:hypothetical protein